MADYAFVVGIEQYLNSSFPNVRFAEADAREMAEALKDVGYEVDCVLLNQQATKNNIEHRLLELIDSLGKDDRLLFYYAGHGFAEVGNTVLSCSDSSLKRIGDTGIRMNWLLDKINESACDKVMFFLDACHAGAAALKSERSVLDSMSNEEIEGFFSEAEHKVCFAACKFNQTSVSWSKLKHGIWTHYLLKALRGEVRSALQNGRFLTATKLQDYLQKEVPLTAKAAVVQGHKQTPMLYGPQTGTFHVADLQDFLDKREKLDEANNEYGSASFKAFEEVAVRRLVGFKEFHKVPREVAEYAESFIQRIAAEDVDQRLEDMAARIRSKFKLKRNELKVEKGGYSRTDLNMPFGANKAKRMPQTRYFSRNSQM
jgi:hypothetical protein